jgi:hypothetical protein
MNEEPTMNVTNAAVLKPAWWSPWLTVFYVDTINQMAFDIFDRRGVHPWHIRELVHPSDEYVGIKCRIPRRKITQFLYSMVELRKLILLNHPGYDEFCHDIIYDTFESVRECSW